MKTKTDYFGAAKIREIRLGELGDMALENTEAHRIGAATFRRKLAESLHRFGAMYENTGPGARGEQIT